MGNDLFAGGGSAAIGGYTRPISEKMALLHQLNWHAHGRFCSRGPVLCLIGTANNDIKHIRLSFGPAIPTKAVLVQIVSRVRGM